MWMQNGLPKNGLIYCLRNKACAEYNYIARYVNRLKESIISNKMVIMVNVINFGPRLGMSKVTLLLCQVW